MFHKIKAIIILMSKQQQQQPKTGKRPQQQSFSQMSPGEEAKQGGNSVQASSADSILMNPPNFNRMLFYKMEKLSNKGWSYHPRLIRVDEHSIAYFSKIPKDYTETENQRECPSVEKRTTKPKASIPLKKIMGVVEVTEEDQKKYKKLAKAPDLGIKILFKKKYLVNGEYISKAHDFDEDSDYESPEEDNGGNDDSMRSKSKGKKPNPAGPNLEAWYLVSNSMQDKEECIEALILSARQVNAKYLRDPNKNEYANEIINKKLQKVQSNLSRSRQQIEVDNEEEEEQSNDELVVKKRGQSPGKKDASPAKKKPPPGKNAQQIPLFQKPATSNDRSKNGLHSRSDSNFSDLNQVLKHNLNINNVNIDAEGNVNDVQNKRGGGQHDDDGESDEDNYDEYNQDGRERLNKLKNNIDRYYKQSQKLHEEQTKKESKGWDLKFQNYWGYLISADKNLKDSMTLSERFFDHIGSFRKKSQQILHNIVNELHKPLSQREHQPLSQIGDEHAVFLDDDDQFMNPAQQTRTMFYFVDNICFKITHQGELHGNQADQYNQTNMSKQGGGGLNTSMIDNSYMTSAQQQSKNQDPFQNLKWKMYGREFLSLDVMFDTLYLLSKPEADHKLRVPLSALIDFKGFRAVAVASIPIQPSLGPSIGFYTDGKYVPHDPKLKQELSFVGDVLNLKENRINQKGQGAQFESVPVSFFIKVYNYQPPENDSKGNNPDTPTKKSQEFHFTDLHYLEQPYYVLKTSEIFPFDQDQSEYPRKDRHLRPEFICSYERPLKADARKDLGYHVSKDTKSKDDENDQVDLNEATRYLRSTVIPNLVNMLDSLMIMPIDSESLELTFHSQGVNMRYLGMVTSLSVVPHVRDVCITEMIARACKNIINKQVAGMILEHQRRFQENEEKREQLKKQWNNRHYNTSNTNLNTTQANGLRRQNQLNQQTQQEYEQKERELLEESRLLSQNMDDQIKMAIVDYMNLIFGAGAETEDFWTTVLLPYVSQYYSYPLDDLMRSTRYLNALYFAFTTHFGLKLNKISATQKVPDTSQQRLDRFQNQQQSQQQQQKDDDFFKEFGKSETPFGAPERSYNRIEIVGKAKTYGLRNLSYKMLADKYREYRNEGRIENALKCCKMKRLMKRLLEQGIGGKNDDVATIADICEIALDNGEYKIAKEQAVQGLKNVSSPLHSEAIKFYCILMRAFYGMDFTQEADQYFSKALATLDHHWGPFHPLHSTIYGIMAHLLIQRGKLDEAKFLYESSLICSLRVLGPNHIQTAEIHIDFGRLYLRMKNKDESLQHFEEAYLIYESYYGLNSLQTANAAMQIATILEEQQGKLNDAHRYVQTAAAAYREIYGDESEHTILAQFLTLSISYALKHTNVREQCERLFEQLVKRDKQSDLENSKLMSNNNNGQQQNKVAPINQEFEGRITKIKELCVAAFILEMTRSLKREEKQNLKSYCDKVLFRAHREKQERQQRPGNPSMMMEEIMDEDDNLPSLADLHQKIDQVKIASLSALKFEENGKQCLQQLYEEISTNSFYTYSFGNYYKKVLDSVFSQVKEDLKKQQSQGAGTQSAKPNSKFGMDQNALYDNWIVADDPKEFFKRIIKCFENVNFYNLLIQ